MCSCPRCCVTVKCVSAVHPKLWKARRRVGGPGRKLSRKRSQQITLMVRSAVKIPWELSFQADPMRTSGMKTLTPGPHPRLISKNALFLLISLFIFWCTRSMICFFSAHFPTGSREVRWRRTIQLHTRMLCLIPSPLGYCSSGNRSSLKKTVT